MLASRPSASYTQSAYVVLVAGAPNSTTPVAGPRRYVQRSRSFAPSAELCIVSDASPAATGSRQVVDGTSSESQSPESSQMPVLQRASGSWQALPVGSKWQAAAPPQP